MSEAVEIAQPAGRGALTMVRKIEEEKRDSGRGEDGLSFQGASARSREWL